MLNNIKIFYRMSVSIILMLVAIIAVVVWAVVGQLSTLSEGAELRQLASLQKTLQARINDSSAEALVTIDAILSAPGVAEAFANNDRETLQSLTLPVFKTLKDKYDVKQFQFHLSPATSFLRLHKTEKFGDDLSTFRFTVLNANSRKEAQFGLEKGVAGIGLRGVTPVFYQNNHIGSAEIGLSFGQTFFDTFTERYDVPAALYVANDAFGNYTTFASTISGTSAISQTAFRDALDGKNTLTKVTVAGKPYAVLIAPINDFSGKPLAVVELLLDRSKDVAIFNSTLYKVLLIGGISLLVGLLLALLLSRSITKPIENLTQNAADVSRGDFEVEILGTERKDEIGGLARAVSRMAESIKLAMERLM